MSNESKRVIVRERYGSIARNSESCCGTSVVASKNESCCNGNDAVSISEAIGYTAEEIASLPDSADLGLGCGNPTALAEIRPGDTIVDLGSGGGIDCFLAAKRTGADGKVIGVDMTPDMLDRARENAARAGYENVEFRLGEIENLPMADSTVDLIISNCVINLSIDKKRVFEEAYRVLKPGGKLAVSDLTLNGELPDSIRELAAAYSACVGGAIDKGDYLGLMRDAGFESIEIVSENEFTSDLVVRNEEDEDIEIPAGVVVSVGIRAVKPE